MISAEIGFADSGLLEIAGPKAETKSSQQGVWVGRTDGERDSSGAPGLFSGNEVTSADL